MEEHWSSKPVVVGSTPAGPIMVAAERIKEKVDQEVIDRNSDVVLKALSSRGKVSCCDYLSNCIEFRKLLRLYENLVLQNHREARRHRTTGACWIRWEPSGSSASFGMISSTRYKLEQIWPCWKCILNWNPTGKQKFLGKQFHDPTVNR